MATFVVTDPNTGQKVKLTGDSPPSEQELEQIFSQLGSTQQQPEPQAQPQQRGGGRSVQGQQTEREGFVGSGVIEPALAVASGLIAEPLAGLAGIASGGDAEAVQRARSALTIAPKTKAGQEGLKTLGDLIQSGIDIVNFPISGLAGLAELVTGGGVDQASQTVESVQDEGVSKTLGRRTFEETGSPLASAIAETTPTALMSAFGLKTKPGQAAKIDSTRAAEINKVITAGEKAGVPVLTSDLFTPKTIVGRLNQQFAERIPGFGTGGKRGAQQTARVNALVELDQNIPKIQASDIIENLSTSANKFKQAAGKRLNTVIEKMDDTGQPVPVDVTLKSIDSVLESLTRKGKVQDKGLIKEIQDLRSTLDEAPQTFSSLREFRTDARSIANKVDASGRSQVRSSDKAKIDRVINGLTSDLDDFVLNNADQRSLSRYKTADRVYAEEFQKLSKSRLKGVLDKGDINPELVNNLLFSSSPSQVNLLFKNLDTSGRSNARMALYRKALDNSITKGQLSPEKFTTQLNKMRDNFDVFFRGDAKAELQGIKRLMESTARAGESGVVTPTGQTVQASLAAGALAGASIGDPKAIATLLTGGTLGLINKAYESKGVRDALIRLGKSPQRSTLSADLMRSIPLLVESANRSLEENTQ
jgi:hypothetical protein